MQKDVLKPSDGEMEILQILWQIEPASVRQIHEVLQQKKEVGYTTTLKQLQRMVDKGMVMRNEVEKTHTYKTLLNETETKAKVLDRLSQTLFKGSAMDMVMHALGNTDTDPRELEKLKSWLSKQEKGGRND